MIAARYRSMLTTNGFTLIELMIVVVILGVIGSLAVRSYHKYVVKARTSEVYEMIGELRIREEAYKAEHSNYLPSNINGSSENLSLYYPALRTGPQASGATGISLEPVAKTYNLTTGAGGTWRTLGIRPARPQLYCGYLVRAGDANQALPALSSCLPWFNNQVPKVKWYCIIAACDMDGDGIYSRFITTMENQNIFLEHEGE